jgi:hypothetical protein
VAAKVLGHFIRLCGRRYLLELLGPLLKELALEDKDVEVRVPPPSAPWSRINHHFSFLCLRQQIDSFRCELAEDVVQQHVVELSAICTKFLQRIDSMVDQCPLYDFLPSTMCLIAV